MTSVRISPRGATLSLGGWLNGISLNKRLSAGEGQAPAMPDGALAIWYGADYSDTDKVLPNDAAEFPPSQDILRTPRHLFKDANFFYVSDGSTVTDWDATDPDENVDEAATLDLAANGYINAVANSGRTSVTLPSGTYSLCVSAKRDDDSDQSFRLVAANGSASISGGDSGELVATSAWQRFKLTFTVTVGGTVDFIALFTKDSESAAALQIVDFELFPGSDDLHQPIAGHVYFGKHRYDSEAQPTEFGSGEISLIDTLGFFQSPVGATMEAFTALCLVERFEEGGDYQAWLSKMRLAYNSAGIFTLGLGPTVQLGDGPFGINVQMRDIGNNDFTPWEGLRQWPGAPAEDLVGDDYHLFTTRWDGAQLQVWFDDVLMWEQPVGEFETAYDKLDFFFGSVGLGGESMAAYGFAGGALYARALENTEVRDAYAALKAAATGAGVTVAPAPTRIYCAEGDSITAANGGYAYLSQPDIDPKTYLTVRGRSGSFINSLESRAALIDAIIPPRDCIPILSVMIGTNDLTDDELNLTTWLADLASYLDDRRTAGWKVIVCTVLPNTGPEVTAARGTVNTEIRTWEGVHADAICDFADNATMGPDAAAEDTDLYIDGIHPTEAGHAILAPIMTAAINAVLAA